LTLAGTFATDVLLLFRDTIVAVEVAALNVTLPVAAVPLPVTVDGAIDRPVSETTGSTVRMVVSFAPAVFAPSVTCVIAETDVVAMVKLAELAPPGMAKPAGTGATVGSLVVRVTGVDTAAVEASVTVTVEVIPPLTITGFAEMLFTATGLIVRFADFELVANAALIVAVTVAGTAWLKIWKFALDSPVGIIRLPVLNAAIEGWLLVKVTISPPPVVAFLSLTVPVSTVPPVTLEAESVMEVTGSKTLTFTVV
jgi:hypothetical protein